MGNVWSTAERISVLTLHMISTGSFGSDRSLISLKKAKQTILTLKVPRFLFPDDIALEI